MSVIIQEDHFPEVVENNKATRRLELTGVKEILKHANARREFFKTMPDGRYKKMLGYINSLSRAKQIEYGYEDGQVPTDPTPPKEDKDLLMNKTFETIREILGNEALDNESALRTAGLTLAGAVNYIHPYEDGNGRVGRVAHYLIEFGNQRGDEAFQNELYAIVAKLPMYDSDKAIALYDTPPPELDLALRQSASVNFESSYKGLDPRKRATKKVETFLDMMKDTASVPVQTEVLLPEMGSLDSTPKYKKLQPGQIGGKQLYEKSYIAMSSIPNRGPNEIPEGANRLKREKNPNATQKIYIPIELI